MARRKSLSDLLGYDRTPGSKAKGGYQITPDQFDRNRAHSVRERARRRRRPRDPATAQRIQSI
jgi:hypothetical protein